VRIKPDSAAQNHPLLSLIDSMLAKLQRAAEKEGAGTSRRCKLVRVWARAHGVSRIFQQPACAGGQIRNAFEPCTECR
jgi:hypothetical protein